MMAATMGSNASTDDYEVTEQGRLREVAVQGGQREYAMWMHLSVIAHIMLPVVPFLIPLIMWSTRKDEGRFIDDHGREAMNFQISLVLYTFVLLIMSFTIIPIVGFLTAGLGLLLLVPASLAPYVLGIIGIVKAANASSRGEYYRYPMTLRLIPQAPVG